MEERLGAGTTALADLSVRDRTAVDARHSACLYRPAHHAGPGHIAWGAGGCQRVSQGRPDHHRARHCHERREPCVHRLRSEEHTSELQSLMRISYAVFCLKKTNNNPNKLTITT